LITSVGAKIQLFLRNGPIVIGKNCNFANYSRKIQVNLKKNCDSRAVFSRFSDFMDRDYMFSMEVTRLIERCRQGDADALGELYKAYAQRMRGVCRRYISDEQAVDDVLHDAFVIIFTSFDRLRDNRKAEAWMMAIARNVASK